VAPLRPSGHRASAASPAVTSRPAAAALRAAGIRTVIVSLTLAQCVAYFARRLGTDAHIGTEPDGNGGFRHVFPATKPALLAQHARALGIPPQQVAAAGDSPGDIPMLRAARTSIYVGATLPDGFTPTWHLPQAPIDEIARILLAPGSPDTPPADRERNSDSCDI
jgi:phosphoserine phosphatase